MVKTKEYLGKYIVYSDGKIYSKVKKRFLKKQTMSIGYEAYMLGNKLTYLHRILGECFIPNPENKSHINHKDGIRNNNDLNNLEWNTHSENLKHAYRELKINKSTMFSTQDIYDIRNSKISAKKLCIKYNCAESTIYAIRNKSIGGHL